MLVYVFMKLKYLFGFDLRKPRNFQFNSKDKKNTAPAIYEDLEPRQKEHADCRS